MRIRELEESTYNSLKKRPTCKITGLMLTWRQSKAFGSYCSLPVKQLFAKHKNVKAVRAVMKGWVYFPPTNAYYADAHSWSRSTGKIGVPVKVRAKFYKEVFQATQICKFPGCPHTVPFEFLKLGTCCNQHYSQGRRIRLRDYGLRDLKFRCALDGLRFYRTEDVAAHLRSIHQFSNQQMENYYRTYLLKRTDNHGFCKWCGKPTGLHNFSRGYNDFCHNASCAVLWYNKNTNRLERCAVSMRRTTASGDVLPTQLGYWLKLGFRSVDAQHILRSLFRDRQNDVQALMRRKGISEPEAVLLRKKITGKWMQKFHHKVPYSAASQEFFWRLWERIKNRISPHEVFFATFHVGKRQSKKNLEWLQEVERTFYKLDFYISGINFIIEFDDDNHRRTISILKDKKRDAEIMAALNQKAALHRVAIKAFREHPSQIVEGLSRLIFASLEGGTR